jgi:hypothetical protein
MSDDRGPFFVRQSRVGIWDSVSETTAADLTFPVDVLLDVIDADCETSIWEIEKLDSPEVDYLVPALVPRSNSSFPEIRFRFISSWKLEQLGLTKRKTVGTSLDDQLNEKSMHWVVEISTVDEAIRFAKGLIVRPMNLYTKEDVMKRFAFSLQEHRLQTNSFKGELLLELLKGNHLRSATSNAEFPADTIAPHAPV